MMTEIGIIGVFLLAPAWIYLVVRFAFGAYYRALIIYLLNIKFMERSLSNGNETEETFARKILS